MKWKLLLLIACVAAAGIVAPAAKAKFDYGYHFLAERDAPLIEVPQPPPGISANPTEISVKFTDAGAGLDEIVIRAEQSGKNHDILRKTYPAGTKQALESFVIDGKDRKFAEGQLRFTVSAFDKSFWSNSSKHNFALEIDYRAPKLEVLTSQHNAVRTGVELVFYRVLDDKTSFSGVLVGANLYPGFFAAKLDQAFEAVPDMRFAFFSVPPGFDIDRGKILVLARDKAGNDAMASILYRAQERSPGVIRETLPRTGFDAAIDVLYERYLADEARIGKSRPREFLPAVRDDEKLARFAELAGNYQKLIERGLEPMFLRPKQQRLWSGKFALIPGLRQPFRVGDTKEYVLDGAVIGRSTVEGIVFEVSPGKEIRAANAGRVMFADKLGMLGNSVILDHGFGLTSTYGLLSAIKCKEGDNLQAGQIIGISGADPLVESGRVEFQIRLNGTPVRPDEWWDETWIKGHIENKIAAVKRQAGVKFMEPLEN